MSAAESPPAAPPVAILPEDGDNSGDGDKGNGALERQGSETPTPTARRFLLDPAHPHHIPPHVAMVTLEASPIPYILLNAHPFARPNVYLSAFRRSGSTRTVSCRRRSTRPWPCRLPLPTR
jgi:hypothetical protein